MHIAAALGRPLVTPYGPTSPVRTGPYRRMDTVIRLDIVCSPCFSRTCSHQSCLRWLGPEPVLREVERQLGVAASLTARRVACDAFASAAAGCDLEEIDDHLRRLAGKPWPPSWM